MNRFMDLVMSSFKVGNRRRIVNNEQILCASHFGKLFEYRHLFPGPVFIIIGTDSRILIVVVASMDDTSYGVRLTTNVWWSSLSIVIYYYITYLS